MSVLHENTRFSPRSHVAFRATAAGGVLVNLTTGAYFEVNAVGALIWARLTAGDSVGEMVAALNASFEVTPEAAQEDVNRWCGEVLAFHLVDSRREGA